uniref:HTH CENPB-type domain-containing protein n=1 Tax=Echeneis naucrates TaxID=173247 RepID=A0A665USA3_ECHNA
MHFVHAHTKTHTHRGDWGKLSHPFLEVREGKSVRAAAKEAKIDRMRLRRYIDKKEKVPLKKTGYDGVTEAKKVFADQLHGLTSLKCRELREPVPDSWSRQERAGVDWLELFKKHHHLSCQTPEATSLARATAFNEHNVSLFFDKLALVMDRYLMLSVRNIFVVYIGN